MNPAKLNSAIKKSLIFPAALLFLVSCNGDSGVKNNMPDPGDTTGAVKEAPQPPKPREDSFVIDDGKSSFACTRTKSVKDVNKEVKIFGGTMNLKMDNATFSANTTIRIKNGWWFSTDKKFEGGKIILDMKSVSALQIGKDEEVETGNPEYLESKKYPTSTLTILSFDSIPGNAKKVTVHAKLQIKDTTGDVTFLSKVEYPDKLHPEIPSQLTGDFHIDGMKWALNPKNAKVTKDDLAFHVVLVTKMK